MGTRSLTKVIESYTGEDGKTKRETLTCMYRQFDGYLRGHGLELAEWLQKYTIVNGIQSDEERVIANGMDCLAAQMFAHFKDGPGGIYCYPPDSKDCGEEYLYEIEQGNENILITVYDTWTNREVFHGTPQELIEEVEGVEA